MKETYCIMQTSQILLSCIIWLCCKQLVLDINLTQTHENIPDYCSELY